MNEKELTEKELIEKEKKLLSYELNSIIKLINIMLDVFIISLILTTIIQILRQI